jgi:hypothetical protein
MPTVYTFFFVKPTSLPYFNVVLKGKKTQYEKIYIHTYMNVNENHTITLEDDETLSK